MSEATKFFFKEKGVEVILKGLPSGGVIIGHYSTLLARWVYEGDVLLLVELEDHDIPGPIQELATIKCSFDNVYKELKNLDNTRVEKFRLKSDFYFNFSGKECVGTIDEMLQLVTKE